MNLSALSALTTPLIATEKRHDGCDKVETVKEQEKKSKRSKRAEKKEKTEAGEQLETLRYHGGRQRPAFSRFILAVTQWLTNDDALFATRVVIVTIAVAVPAVCTSSAAFYYREKGLWALIMAQMGMGTYTADFIYGFVLRVVGTVLGGIAGMVCWVSDLTPSQVPK